jgi:hypothetical protein
VGRFGAADEVVARAFDHPGEDGGGLGRASRAASMIDFISVRTSAATVGS